MDAPWYQWLAPRLSRARLGDVHAQPLLFLRDDGTGVLFRARRWEGRGLTFHTVRQCDTRRPWLTRNRVFFRNRPLADVIRNDRRPEVVTIPQWRSPHFAWIGRVLVAALVLMLGILLLDATASLSVILCLLAPAVGWRFPSLGIPRVDSLAQLPLDARTVASYTQQRIAGEHPEVLEEMPHREPVRQRIDELKTRYGALQSDVVHRIEYPALFDPEAEHTSAFLAALVRAEDLDLRSDIVALEAAASELEILFSVAKRHAERVGIDHLPAPKRDDARRASKVARLARDAGSDGERTAALAQLNRILQQLAIHYLPGVDDTRAIGRG